MLSMTCFVFYIERLILRLSLKVKPSGNKTLLTYNYEDSAWANQEAGYMLGKGGKNISLIIDNADIKKFGFLESLQE